MTNQFDPVRARQVMNAELEQYLRDLQSLVSIDSGTARKAGVDAVGALLRGWYEELGGVVEVHPQPVRGDNFVVRFAGNGSGRVLLIGHMDTVYEEGTVARRPFHVDGNRAVGPGTCDMKAGDLSIVYALRRLLEQGWDDFETVTVLHNSDEEVGSPCSRDLVREEAQRADVVYVLEAGRESGDIVSGRKGIAAFGLSVAGVSSHAGVNHAGGRSAILELAHLIVELERLNGQIPGVTLNVGHLTGGGAINVVPAAASARFEARAFSQDRLEETVARVRQIAERRHVPGTEVSLDVHIEHLPMHRSESTERLVLLAQSLASELGFDVQDTVTGGASDGNTASTAGRPVLDGLGPVGGGAHSEREYVAIDSIAPRTALLAGLVARGASTPW